MTPTPAITYGSVCSGIEAATSAWAPLGWRCAWLAEIKPFPCELLKQRYPWTANLGDLLGVEAQVRRGEVPAPAVLCGGTHCQSFSIAGLQGGMDDERGQLSLEFCKLANAIDSARNKARLEPCVVVWENVPGVLSNDRGVAFGCILAGLAGESLPLEPPGGKWKNAGVVLGPTRAVAWRVLDAQYFGLAQRRKRVWIVASARAGFDPCKVLFESEGLRRDSAPSRSPWQDVTGSLTARTGGGGFPGTDEAIGGQVVSFPDVAPCLRAKHNSSHRADSEAYVGELGAAVSSGEDLARTMLTTEGKSLDAETSTILAVAVGGDLARTLRGEGFDASEDGTGRGTPVIATNGADVAGTLDANVDRKWGSNQWVDQGNGAIEAPGGPQQVMAFDTTQITNPTNRSQPAPDKPCHTLARDAKAPAIVFTGDGETADPVLASSGKKYANAGNNQSLYNCVQQPQARVRRLTPTECERLQGFPDSWTQIAWRNKPPESCPDGHRYEAIGNSWPVNVARWIGERIMAELQDHATIGRCGVNQCGADVFSVEGWVSCQAGHRNPEYVKLEVPHAVAEQAKGGNGGPPTSAPSPQRRVWDVPPEILAEWKARIAQTPERRVVVSVSGGKDSTAMCLFMQHLGIEYTALHMDTGWETAETDHYVREVLPDHIGPVEIIDGGGVDWPEDDEREIMARQLEAMLGKPRSAFIRRIIWKAMFVSRTARWCTEELKVFPFQRWARERFGLKIVNAVGVRAQESKKRSELGMWDMDAVPEKMGGGNYLVWRPLIDWTENDVIDWHLENDVPPNPLYLRGSSRVGCWPCIFARKAEIRQLSMMSPERIEVLRILENFITIRAKVRAETKGKDFLHLDGTEKFRAFFGNPEYRRESRPVRAEGEALGMQGEDLKRYVKDRVPAMARIDKVIAWSETKRDGTYEPLAPLPHEDGCVRWGMCDFSWREPDSPSKPETPAVHLPDFEPVALPILKWAGGKRRLVQALEPLLGPGQIIEPFAGGAAVTLALGRPGGVLSDSCAPLMSLYQWVKRNPHKLWEALTQLHEKAPDPWYDPETKRCTKEAQVYYYAIRAEFNQGQVASLGVAARLLWLNRAGYNGLYRVNKTGGYNVPIGVGPLVLPPKAGILAASAVLQSIQVQCGDFARVIDRAPPVGVVYCDPPYVPNGPGGFTSYSGAFGIDEQVRLAAAARRAAKRGVRVVLSNHLNNITSDLYAGFELLWSGPVKRSISRGSNTPALEGIWLATAKSLPKRIVVLPKPAKPTKTVKPTEPRTPMTTSRSAPEAPYVQRVQVEAKGHFVDVKLGRLTVLFCPTRRFKTTITNGLYLPLEGGAEQVQFRPWSKSPALLMTQAGPDGRLYSKLTWSDGEVSTYTLGGKDGSGKAYRPKGQRQGAPLHEFLEELSHGDDRAYKFLVGAVAGTTAEAEVLTRFDTKAQQDRYAAGQAMLGDLTKGMSPVEVLAAVRSHSTKRASATKAEAKACDVTAAAAIRGVGGNPGEEPLAAARVSVKRAFKLLQDAGIAEAEPAAPRIVKGSILRDLEPLVKVGKKAAKVLKKARKALSKIEDPEIDVALLKALELMMQVQVDDYGAECFLCGAKHSKKFFKKRVKDGMAHVEGLRREAKTWAAAVDAVKLAEQADADARTVYSRAKAHNKASKSGKPLVVDPKHAALRLTLRTARAHLAQLERAVAGHKQARLSKSKAAELRERSEVFAKTAADCKRVQHELGEHSLVTFKSRANKFLPKGQELVVKTNPLVFGLRIDGVDHMGVSGTEEIKLLLAMMAGLHIGDTPAVFIAPDRGWDGKHLAETIRGLKGCRGQIIIPTTVKPAGRLGPYVTIVTEAEIVATTERSAEPEIDDNWQDHIGDLILEEVGNAEFVKWWKESMGGGLPDPGHADRSVFVKSDRYMLFAKPGQLHVVVQILSSGDLKSVYAWRP